MSDGDRMTGPDPAFMTSADWIEISRLLASLWWLLGSAIGFGFSMLLAHGMVPSLATTRDIDADQARRIRPVLYASAVAFLALGMFSLVMLLDRLSIVSTIFWRGAQ